jgi:GTP cyclohydrolase I
MDREPPGNELARAQASRHIEALLRELGVDLHDPELRGTPARVAELMDFLLSGQDAEGAPRLAAIANPDSGAGLVLVRGIRFYSLCAHHLLPFFGEAHVGYLPGERLAGLGDLARTVEYFSRRITLQERIAAGVADFLARGLAARGVAVLLEGRHLCLEMRGQRQQAVFEASAYRGELASPVRRLEFLARVRPGGHADLGDLGGASGPIAPSDLGGPGVETTRG